MTYMHFYSEQQIAKQYLMKDAIQDVKKTLQSLRDGFITMEERTVIEAGDGTMLYMPAVDTKNSYSAIKVISIFPHNPEKELPTSQAVTLLSELNSGQHIATLESSYLTRLRTGAITGIATDQYARKDSKTLGIIGTGGMAFEQCLGVLEVRPISKIILFNRTAVKAEQFKQKLVHFGFTGSIEIVDDVSNLVQQSDIINCATKSNKAVFSDHDVKEGTHINGLGSYTPDMREINEVTISRAHKVVVDDLQGAQHEAGEIIQAVNDNQFNWQQAHTLVDVFDTDIQRDSSDITIFKSVGAAYYDLSVAIGAFNRLTQ